MIRINEEQRNWMKKRFFFNEYQFPVDFLDRKEFLDFIFGGDGFRFDPDDDDDDDDRHNYEIMDCFFDYCMAALQTSPDNRKKIFNIFYEIIEIKDECEENDFLELGFNLEEILICFQGAVNWLYEIKCETQLNDLLKKLNIDYYKKHS